MLNEGYRRREPRKPGLTGSRHEAAIKKGYVDLGLINVKHLHSGWKEYHLASFVSEAMKNGVAFIRDPEDIIGQVNFSLDKLARDIAVEKASWWYEESGLASEREEWDLAERYGEAHREIYNAKVSIRPVRGKTGAGYKVVMSPVYEQVKKKYSLPY